MQKSNGKNTPSDGTPQMLNRWRLLIRQTVAGFTREIFSVPENVNFPPRIPRGADARFAEKGTPPHYFRVPPIVSGRSSRAHGFCNLTRVRGVPWLVRPQSRKVWEGDSRPIRLVAAFACFGVQGLSGPRKTRSRRQALFGHG